MLTPVLISWDPRSLTPFPWSLPGGWYTSKSWRSPTPLASFHHSCYGQSIIFVKRGYFAWDGAKYCLKIYILKRLGFFSVLFQMEELVFERCRKPARAVGKPIFVIMSDGSEMDYGCAAYIRCTLEDNLIWCRLILTKCRIAPISRIPIPEMDLNGAMLFKRCRKAIKTKWRYTFDQVYHFVDSVTVLCMNNKTSTRFRVYEGVHISEIRVSCGGDLRSWGWICSGDNDALPGEKYV